MTSVIKKLITTMLILFSVCVTTWSADIVFPKQISAPPGRFAEINFPDGVTAAVEIPIGWTAGDSEENCFISLNNTEVCFRYERAGGLTPCQWLNLASPYIDAPGDADTKINMVPFSIHLPNGGSAAGCRGRIISPRFKTVNYRLLIYAGDGRFYSLSTTPVYWNKEGDARFIEGFEQQLLQMEESIVLKSTGTPAEAITPEPDVRDEMKKGAKAAAVERAENWEKDSGHKKVQVEEVTLSEKEIDQRNEMKETVRLERKLLSAPTVVINQKDKNEQVSKTLNKRPVFSEIKESVRGLAQKPYVRSEYLIKADKMRLKGLLQEAREEYSALLPSFQYDAVLGLGDVAMAEGDLGAAEKQYEVASRLDPHQPHAFNGLGSVALAKGSTVDALKYFDRAKELDNNNPGTFVNIGWMALTMGKMNDAEAFFMKALAMKPDLDTAAGAVNGLTTVSFNYGEYDEAIQWNSSLLSIFPDYPEARANLVQAYMMKGDGDSAAGEARRLELVSQRIPPVVVLAGRAYLMAGMLEIAADRLCRYSDPEMVQYMPSVVPDCVNALEKSARGPEAAEILSKAAAADDATPEIIVMMAKRLHMEGETVKASQLISAAIKKFPDDRSLKDMYQELKKKLKKSKR